MPQNLSAMEFVSEWRRRSKDLKHIPPRVVRDGPVLENIQRGKDVNILSFPTPRWFELDGGRYIGTGSVNITHDPEEGWTNLGTARVMIHDENTVGFYIAPGRHGRIHRDKAFARGEPFKVAISVGHDPLIFLAGALEVPYGVCEYDFIGGIQGEPVDVIRGEFTGLPIPATAEIVLEGECVPGPEKIEGPFGEWTGYYGSSSRPEPIVKIHTVMHRNDPILLGYTRKWRAPLKAALVWDDLEGAGVPDVRGVWYHEAAGAAYLFLVVSIKQRYPGHARQAGLIATECHAAAYLGRYTVVVDDDIDPTNLNEVLWAVCTRSDPSVDIEILRRCWSGPLDPIIPKDQKGLQLARDHRRDAALRVEGHVSARCRVRARSCAREFWQNGRTNCRKEACAHTERRFTRRSRRRGKFMKLITARNLRVLRVLRGERIVRSRTWHFNSPSPAATMIGRIR